MDGEKKYNCKTPTLSEIRKNCKEFQNDCSNDRMIMTPKIDNLKEIASP